DASRWDSAYRHAVRGCLELSGDGPFIGIGSMENFAQGYKCKGLLFGGPGNLSNGSAALKTQFGEEVSKGMGGVSVQRLQRGAWDMPRFSRWSRPAKMVFEGLWEIEQMMVGPELGEYPLAKSMDQKAVILKVMACPEDSYQIHAKVVNNLSFSASSGADAVLAPFDALSVKPGISTMMMGPEPMMEVEYKLLGPQSAATSNAPSDSQKGDPQWEPASGSLASEHVSEVSSGSRSKHLQRAHRGFCQRSPYERGCKLDDSGAGDEPGAGSGSLYCRRSAPGPTRCRSAREGPGCRRPQEMVVNGFLHAASWSLGRLPRWTKRIALSSTSMPISVAGAGQGLSGCHPRLQGGSRVCCRMSPVCANAQEAYWTKLQHSWTPWCRAFNVRKQ
ncbi:unnamed protein product, partial [Symbiodinium pilosum]